MAETNSQTNLQQPSHPVSHSSVSGGRSQNLLDGGEHPANRNTLAPIILSPNVKRTGASMDVSPVLTSPEAPIQRSPNQKPTRVGGSPGRGLRRGLSKQYGSKKPSEAKMNPKRLHKKLTKSPSKMYGSIEQISEAASEDPNNMSDLANIQDLYYNAKKGEGVHKDETAPLMILDEFYDPKKTIAPSKIKNVYFKAMRKNMVRRKSKVFEEPADFAEQIKEVKDNIRTPNELRIADLKIIEKTHMEKLKSYKDDLPLLKLRKRIMKVWRVISLVCYKIVSHPLFDIFILAVVLINSLLLALDNPTDDVPAISTGVDNMLLGIYTGEMVLKIAGMGFLFNKNSYLRDPWNIMDFVIVVTAYIPIVFVSGGVNLQAFRALRVLRPLRTISNIKALKVIVLTVLAAIGPLLETVFILFFMIMIFAIAGLQLFQGLLKKRCIALGTGIAAVSEDDGNDAINDEIFCNLDSDCYDYDNHIHICAKMIANPNWNITNFDNLPASILMVFQSITKEGWSTIMFMLEKTFSFKPLVSVFFIALLIICSFFLLSLTLAVIKAEFTSKSEEEDGKRKKVKGGESYNVRLAEKLETYKGQVLKLMRKRAREEIKFNKYEFRKENLVAVDVKTNSNAGKRSRRSLVGLNTRRRRFTAMIGGIVLKGTAKKSLGFIRGFFRRLTSDSTKVSPLHPGLVDDPSMRSPTENVSQQNTRALDSHRKLMSGTQSPIKNETHPINETFGENHSTPDPNKTPNPDHKVASLDGIGSIPEANEQSEQSIKTPSEVSLGNGSPSPRASIRNKWNKDGTIQGPIRPVMTEKVQVKPATNNGGVEIINIAGIRNTLNPEAVHELVKTPDRGTPSPIPSSKELSFTEERGRVSSMHKIKSEKKKRKTGLSANLVRQMNQIIMASSKNRSFNRSSQANVHSHSHVHKKRNSEALPSIFDLGAEPSADFDQFGGSMIHSDLLDDSDFFDEEQRHQLLKKKKKSRSLKSRQLTTNIPKLVKVTSRAQLREHQQQPDTVNSMPKLKVPQSVKEDEKQKIVIDVRRFKAVPAFEHDYEADSLDDVMPLKKEREEKRLEEEEIRSLRERRLKLEFRVTRHDNKRAEDRYNERYGGAASSTTLVVQNNETTTKIRQKKKAQQEAEAGEINGTLYGNHSESGGLVSMGRSTSKTFTSKKTMRSGGTARTRFRPTVGHEDDYLSAEKMKDFFEVLKRMNRPFENEATADEKEGVITNKDFSVTKNFKEIRKRDLGSDTINFNNWSGDQILSQTKTQFAVEKVKAALNNQDYDIWREGTMGVMHAARRKIRVFVDSGLFNNFILIAVVLNTVVLATQGLVSGDRATNITNNANLAFTIIFTIEMGLKLIALGFVGYARDKMNLFDCGIVVISLVDMTSLTGSGQNQAVSALKTIRLLRTFRVLRVTKLLRSLSYVKVIIGVVMRSLHKFIFIFVLLLLFIYIYALLGMQIYGGNLNLEDNSGQGRIRQNFDSFIDAFMSVFQIMTQENWNDLLYLTLRAPSVSNAFSLLYLLSWMSIGNYIFLNLFLAILLDEFTGEEVEEELEEMEEENEEDDVNSTGVRSSSTSRLITTGGGGKTNSLKTSSKGSLQGRSQGSIGEQSSLTGSDSGKKSPSHKHAHHAQQKKRVLCRRSLYIFTQDNFLRKFCLSVIYHSKFEAVILFMIVVSSIKLALDTYITTSQVTLTNVSNIFDEFLNIFFALECAFKVISLGFLFDKGSYLRDSWNQLDFIIVVTSLIDMASDNVNLPFIKVLRLLRTLRPLRFVSHNVSMKLIVTALMESVKAIFNVVVVILLVWLMFAILAINILGDKLGYCAVPEDELYYGISKTQCATLGYEWKIALVNFDNVIHGMLSLFLMSTLENWPGIMFSMADANNASDGPKRDANALFAYIFMIIFVFVGSFFLINLFIGVIFLEYTQASKRENQMQKFLTPEQQNWVIMQRLVITVKCDDTNIEPETHWMKPYFKMINHAYFEIFITLIILANIVIMAINYDGSSAGFDNVLKYSNWACSVIFAGELILKHLGLGFKRYWRAGWNKFDAFVVFASILDIIMDFAQQSFMKYIKVAPQIARVFRVLRVTRLFKLIKSLEGLQKMINTLIFSLPSLLNVGALLFLVYFIYAILGTFLFGTIESGDSINDLYNFKNAANSFVTLFICSTGENWYIYMFDTINPAECISGTSSCGTPAAYPFWISFTVICQYIFLNLFILVILQQFEEYHLNPDNPVNKFRETLEDVFRPHWEKYALKYGGLHLHETQLLDFFTTLPTPLGYKDTDFTKKQIAKDILKMTLSSDGAGMIYYNDVLHAAFKNGFNRDPVTDFTQYQYLLKEETKIRAKLEKLKPKMTVKAEARLAIREKTFKGDRNVVNPILRMLFVGMTIKTWMNYSNIVGEKMKAAKKNQMEYIYSDSDEDDYITESSEEDEYSYEEEEEEDQEEDHEQISEENEEDEEDHDEKTPNAHATSREQGSGGVNPTNNSHAAVSTSRKAQEKIFRFDSDDEKEMLYGDDKVENDVKIEGLVTNSKKDVHDDERHKVLLNNSLNVNRGKSTEDNKRKSSFTGGAQGPRIFMQTVEGEIRDITPRATPIGSKNNIEPSFDVANKKKDH